ncbi:hypothetical protein G3O08_16400 [Cryomorpha ignava]|uniref:Dockerin domain-containing protein n=1 Tax=Cryomorpha ignava TaxID=101383 RepID=A0A7K3WVX8_9FLAO|nr:GEVED domain-containing protein [Cryomorpha ignava]NEN25082.1 hypothetical protein [Cryomorpha ignava]
MRKPFTNLVGACCSLVFLTLISTNIASAQYCASSSTDSGFEWLTNVTFGGVDNDTEGSGYSDFTDQVGTVSPGIPFSFTASHTQSFSGDNEHLQVWVDWNQDEVFSPNERTQFAVCTDPCTRTQMIPVPPGALLGATRMRVILSYNIAAAGPCITAFDGEVEDYGVNVVPGACTAPDFTYTVTNDCEAENYDVSAFLTDFGSNTFVTVYLTRSDAVPVSPVTLIVALEGQTVNILNNVPFGVTVSASIEGQNPICNLTTNFAQLICPVTNDECADALPLPCNGSYLGTNIGATVDTVGCAPFGNGAPGVWFTYTPTAQTIVTLATCDPQTTFDTDLTVFTGTCGELTCFDGFGFGGYTDGSTPFCNLTGQFFSAGGTFTAFADETYYILLAGYFAGEEGQYNLTVTCEELTCTSPDLALSVVDINGDPIEGCLAAGADYYVNASLSNGTGNANYDVTVNGGTPVSIPAGGSAILGPVSTGSPANVLATGADAPLCGASGSAASPEVCAALNDLPCNAIAIPTDGTLITGSNIGATADTNEVAPPNGACNGTMSWCDGAVVNNSIWYTFVGPASGRVRIDGCNPGSSFDSQFAIYTADDCNDYDTYTLIGANDDRPAPLFAACEFGLFRSGIELCIEEGVTYYLQVDGYFGATGIAGITIDEIDAEACNCSPPVFPDAGFTLANTVAYCAVDTVGYQVTFYTPEDPGSSEFFIYTYSIDGGNSGVEFVAAGDSVTLADIIPLGTVISATITLSDSSCTGVVPLFPFNFAIAQNTAACDLDCNGVAGGPALPGTACDDGDPLTTGDSYNADCECSGFPAISNDEPCDAIPLECDVTVNGTTLGATSTGAPTDFCGTFSGAPGVWYTIVGNGADIDLSLCGSSYDTQVQVYTGTCDDLICVGGNDDSCGLQSEYTIAASQSGVTYYVYVYGFASGTGTFTITPTCNVANPAVLNGTVNWNSNCGNRDATVRFYTPGTATLIATYNTTIAADGTFNIPNVAIGTYDVIVKVQGYLAKGIEDVVIAAGNNSLAVGAIRNGNINNDGAVNIFDVSLINAAFNTSVGNPSYNSLADLNCDGNINIFDISILNASFNQSGATAPL